MARLSVFILFLFAAIGIGAASAAEPTFPTLTGRVVDDAHILDASTRAGVERKLADLESKTGRQLVVVTLKSLQGYEIEDYGYRLGRAWGIGEKAKNTGALLIVAPNEHRVRIEVGYGLEGTLTDAVSRLIIENAILPRFRVNDFAGGIQRGVDDLTQVLTGDVEDFKRRAAEQDNGPQGTAGIGQFIWIILFLGFWLFLVLRSRRRGWRGGGMPWIIPMGGGFPGGGWGGGGSGGGFSGGGGSFGGGGASGRW
ncbi:MAG TPA: TPM domain-containing protein [Micropepsaceae bacterium]|nr:TPM domain-containing protein [Micropepsaceae bacterium]